MNREQARAAINARPLTEFYTLERSRHGGSNQYICPSCNSGSGKNGTGALTIYPDSNRIYCHACDANGGQFGGKGQDTLGALRILWECSENAVFERMGYIIDSRPTAAQDFTDTPRATQNGLQARTGETIPTATQTPHNALQSDYTAYYAACRERLKQSQEAISYLQGRGISLDTAAAYNVGFDPVSDPAGAGHPTPRIILPTCSTHYVARAIRPDTPKQWAKMNNKGGKPAIFNPDALYNTDNETVFITEGFIDALSILEVGATAIALNSANNAGKLIEMLQSHRTTATLILCLDNDDAGRKATETLKQGLQRLNISYITSDICNGYKDPNEALTGDRNGFLNAIREAERQNAARPDSVSSYIATLMSGEIAKYKECKDRKTGFANLDEISKGLYTGLYIVAAISSLGKTTFCHQLADNLATAGEDVLFFSLEQSRLELVSKSLARRTAQKDITTAVNSLSIRRGYLPQNVLTAATEYTADIADRLSIIEGNFNCNISFIGEYVRRYIQKTGKKPVVFVDYLQILQPEKDEKGRTQTTKETVDSTVTELKRISREQGLTIFVISSVNRSNYLLPIDFESLKESGCIEYTADVIWGLQLQCLNDEKFKKKDIEDKREIIKKEKRAKTRKIELSCLKNRYGISNYSAFFYYIPEFDLFTEVNTPKDFDDEPTEQKKAINRR